MPVLTLGSCVARSPCQAHWELTGTELGSCVVCVIDVLDIYNPTHVYQKAKYYCWGVLLNPWTDSPSSLWASWRGSVSIAHLSVISSSFLTHLTLGSYSLPLLRYTQCCLFCRTSEGSVKKKKNPTKPCHYSYPQYLYHCPYSAVFSPHCLFTLTCPPTHSSYTCCWITQQLLAHLCWWLFCFIAVFGGNFWTVFFRHM